MKFAYSFVILFFTFHDGSSFTIPSSNLFGDFTTTQLHMAGFGGGGATTSTRSNKKSKNKKKKKKEQSSFDVSSAFLRSEKLYDVMALESAKQMMLEEDEGEEENLFSEFVVAARYNPNSSNPQQQRIAGSNSVSDWTPVAQICLLRSRANTNEDSRLPPQLTEAISVHCREIHHAAVLSAPIFASLPRNDIEYSVETVDSFYKFVYDFVLEENNSNKKKGSSSHDDLENMTLKDARMELELEEGCSDLTLIKKAYRSLSFQYHPDRFIRTKNNDDEKIEEDLKKKASEKFSKVKYAYELMIRSGVTAATSGSSSSPSSSTSSTVSSTSSSSWYASLGGRERTDFKGPLELLPLKEAQSRMDRCMRTQEGYKSAVCGLDPDLVTSFTARNQANVAQNRL